MSKDGKEKDLDCFRTEWQNEIKARQLHGSETQSSSNIKIEDGSQPIQSNAPLVSHNQGNILKTASASIPQLDYQDDNSLDSNSSWASEKAKLPLYNYNESTDSSEYYPFRILTQFLNEAPKKANKTKQSGKQSQSASGETYSKRKYFHSTSLEQRTKVCKQDPGAPKSPDVNTQHDSKRILDLFLADLDEINEIPFFDSTLSREVAINIFQYLDMKALCRCAQVSRSWRSLADDEHLWCAISHQLGCEEGTRVGDYQNWKSKVRLFVEEKQLLVSNWKARVGKPYNLSYAKGGVVCAVHFHESTIVAGYTNCCVKSWNTLTGDSCTFNASNTSMVIDESAEDLGRIHNEIKHLKTTAQTTSASFRHGFVDVWWNDISTDPVHTITFNNPDVSCLCVQDADRSQSVVAASQSTRVHVAAVNEEAGRTLADFNMANPVSNLLWLQGSHGSEATIPHLLVSTTNSVWLKEFDTHPDAPPTTSMSYDEMKFKEVHSVFMAPVTCTTVRPKSLEAAIGFNMTTGPSIEIRVNIYDLDVIKLKTSLKGHTWFISCMHLPPGLANQLVTGSGDRKVRLFDTHAHTTPVQTLAGHSAKVTCVQMDEVKVVSGDEAGFVCVWDQRMGRKLWEIHNRHPVQFCQFDRRLLVIGNVPYQKFSDDDEFESVSSLRYRGTVQFYDFLADQQRPGIPEICLSSYNEPEASISNLGLAVPYDSF